MATEEVVLETLCFDMGIEQPWVVLRRSISGMDDLSIIEGQTGGEEGHKITEHIVAELGWALLNEA